ncbi:MAG: hypothetical protein WCX71_00880 [Candidatus Buchananbacteria bacterium]
MFELSKQTNPEVLGPVSDKEVTYDGTKIEINEKNETQIEEEKTEIESDHEQKAGEERGEIMTREQVNDFLKRGLKFFRGIRNSEQESLEHHYSNELINFQGTEKEFALELLEKHRDYVIMENIEEFDGLDREVALKMMGIGDATFVINHPERFKGLVLDKKFALEAITPSSGGTIDGPCRSILKNAEKFQGLDKEIVLKLIERREGWSFFHSLVRGNFQNIPLDKEIAQKLIETGWDGIDLVFVNHKKFKKSDRAEIRQMLIDAGQSERLSRHEYFPEDEH